MTQVRSAAPRRAQASAASRRAGYLIGALINVVLLWLVNVWPGWDVLPFLTDDTPRVLGIVNASMVAGVVVDVVLAVRNPDWLVAVGNLVTTGIGLAAVVAVWRVFPLAFEDGFDWSTIARILLVVAVVGSVIALVVNVVKLVRAPAGGPSAER
jgi:hypothetical protein